MELLGKIVTKEFKGFGVFEGVVESYDSSTGFYKILYEDGDSEEADLSEVSRLLSSSSSSPDAVVQSISVNSKVGTAKRVGRKPKKRRRNDPGKSSNVLTVDNSEHNLGSEVELGQIAVNDFNASVVNVNGNSDFIVGNGGFDLNRGINVDDGVENGGIRGCIDLNLSVDDDGCDENATRVEKVGSFGRIERGFDLNLGIHDNGENGTVNNNACLGSGDEVKDGDANLVSSRLCDVEVTTPNQYQNGNSGSRKRRKVTETVLRRSARRSKAASINENNASITKTEDEVNDLSGVIDEAEEKPVPKMLERVIEPQSPPPKIELPPSSAKLNLEGIPVLDLFSTYACLRSFSTILYLSPFELEDLVAALKSRVSNQLIDLIHVAILQTLRKHLDFLSSEGCESALTCLRNINWDLLDEITWPVFMVEYLLIHGSGLKPGFSLNQLKLFDGEYYKKPAEVKIELLRCLCDDVVEVEAIRSELSKRTVIAEVNMESGRTMCSERKRKTSLEVPVDSCLSEGMKEEVADGNSDECCLCKMDGNLICCDGCPAAYHSKCVGIVSSLLPEGNWYCPECVIGKLGFENKPQRHIRGAELLGTDTCGRLFFGCFNYLLVSDSCDAEALCSYYHKDDLGAITQLLQSSTVLYSSILSAISQYWAFPTDSCQPKSDLGGASDGKKAKRFIISRNSGHLGSEHSEPADLFDSDTAKPSIETKSLFTSSEGSGEVLEENDVIQKSPSPVSNMAARRKYGKKLSASKQKKKKGSSAGKDISVSKDKEENILQEQSGDGYLNSYSFARTASSVVEELLRKPSSKVNIDATKTEEQIISIQLKFILQKSTKSCWTTIQDLNKKRRVEKCGWCYCCRFPVEGRGCLFSDQNRNSVSDALRVEIEGVLKSNKKGHLVDVICYILFMEERLRGLLSGPWLQPQYSELWRQSVLKASDVSLLKLPLLTLETNLRPAALSADWWKHVDLVSTMGSASLFVASSRATSKNSISRKKVRYADPETKSSSAVRGLVFFWWRGGKTSRSLFNCKVIPRSFASKVARKAGCMKIPDLQYPEASEHARRTKCVAWRASVEKSTSLEQLALQVREFDLFIRWDDIENTHPHSLLDKESIKSIRLFKKVIVRRKSLEGSVARYLLDFGKRRSVPDVVLKHGKKLEKSDCEKKKYWLDEVYVPLHLLKSFEERRITREAGKKISSKSRRAVKVTKKPSREKGFDYLFSRAERVESYQCGHCNKNVLISEAVSCELCNGYFHKRHVMKSSVGISSGCLYTCHKCRAGKHITKESNPGRRKGGKLPGTKNMKIVNEGHSATLRTKPRKKGKNSGSGRQVLLRSAKTTPRQEKILSQKNKNVSTGIVLRRSARQVKCTTLQPKKVVGQKRKRNKVRTVASKKTPKPKGLFLWQKKRTKISHSFWINGLKLSGKENDERVIQFKRRKLLVPFEFSAKVDDQPKCSLCSHQGSTTSALVYIACELCGDWFHGDAFGLSKENIEYLMGFKCHVCRERNPPVCPFIEDSRDGNSPFIEATCEARDAQGSSEAVAARKETVEGSSGLLEVDTERNCDGTLDQDENQMLNSESGVENRPLTSKDVAPCSVDNDSLFIEASSVAQDTPSLPVVVAVQKETVEGSSGLLEVHTSRNCDGNLDQDKTPMLDSELRVVKDSNTLFTEAFSEVQNPQELPETVAVQKETEGSSGLLEVDTAQGCDTPMLDVELRVENRSPSSMEVASCSGKITNLFIEASSEACDARRLPDIVAVRKETDCVTQLMCNGGSSGLLEANATHSYDGNLHQDETPIIDSELIVANGLANGSAHLVKDSDEKNILEEKQIS
ncbi:hypothetical protein SOVF_030890 [Spinacia oleracea]|nr:hypothetical protein SOVF_030890 [Spinacia oleracea]